jgi:uncharacterized protein (TIGR02145 family)
MRYLTGKFVVMLAFLALFLACNNRKENWQVDDLFSGFTLKKEAADSILYTYPDKFSLLDTVKVGFTAKYKYKMTKSAECTFKLNYNSAVATCSISTVTNEITYKASTATTNDVVSIDITDMWNRKKTITLSLTSKNNAAPITSAVISERFIASGYEITIDASKSKDADASMGGGIVSYEYTIGNLPSVQTSSTIFKDTLTDRFKDIGIYSIKVKAIDNESLATTSTYSFNVGLTDIQKNIYPVVVIGNPGQVWMGADLRTKRYADSTIIPDGTNSLSWDTLKTGAFATGPEILYNWYAATNTKNICPAGWHLPTAAEWTTLVNGLGGIAAAGPHLRSSVMDSWAANSVGDNSSGFTAIYTDMISGKGTYYNTGLHGYWWSSTAVNTSQAKRLHLVLNADTINAGNKTDGYAIRCLKN